MTSNLVQEHIGEANEIGYQLRPPFDATKDKDLGMTSLNEPSLLRITASTNKFLRAIVEPILKSHFKRDEFLGRINEMVVFHHFTDSDIDDIVTMELQAWAAKARQRHDITITWSEEVVSRLSKQFNERYGFRSIKHAVQKEVVNLLAYSHERDIVKNGDRVKLEVEGLAVMQEDEGKELLDGIVVKVLEGTNPGKKTGWSVF